MTRHRRQIIPDGLIVAAMLAVAIVVVVVVLLVAADILQTVGNP